MANYNQDFSDEKLISWVQQKRSFASFRHEATAYDACWKFLKASDMKKGSSKFKMNSRYLSFVKAFAKEVKSCLSQLKSKDPKWVDKKEWFEVQIDSWVETKEESFKNLFS